MNDLRSTCVAMLAAVQAALVLGALAGGVPATAQEPVEDPLDGGIVPIESRAGQELLGRDILPVRRQPTGYRPTGMLPVLRLEPVTDAAVRERLQRLMRRFPEAPEILRSRDLLMARGDGMAYWVSRASGAFKVTESRETMSAHSRLGPWDSLQVALDQIAGAGLLEPREGEEVDLLFASEVHNAFTTDPEGDHPDEEFVSDRYFGFGRRFDGVPVIGSQLVVRLNGHGDLVMVQSSWRSIAGPGREMVELSDEPLEELVVRDPSFVEQHGRRVGADAVSILDAYCGYLEASAERSQDELRPGCWVVYHLGRHRGEATAQIAVSLERRRPDGELVGRPWDGRAR